MLFLGWAFLILGKTVSIMTILLLFLIMIINIIMIIIVTIRPCPDREEQAG